MTPLTPIQQAKKALEAISGLVSAQFVSTQTQEADTDAFIGIKNIADAALHTLSTLPVGVDREAEDDLEMRMCRWVGLGGEKPSRADIAKYVAQELDNREDLDAVFVAAILALLPAPATQGVPEGWKLVPKELPDAMFLAAKANIEKQTKHKTILDIKLSISELYNAMLSASPLPPAPGAETGEFVLVPKAALDWLNGSGPDHEGKWFGEVEDALPQSKPPRKYFWRSHFRKICNAITGKPTLYTYDKSQRTLVATPSPLPDSGRDSNAGEKK